MYGGALPTCQTLVLFRGELPQISCHNTIVRMRTQQGEHELVNISALGMQQSYGVVMVVIVIYHLLWYNRRRQVAT